MQGTLLCYISLLSTSWAQPCTQPYSDQPSHASNCSLMFHYNSIERAPTPICSVPPHCIRPASPLSMYCGGATHFMLHIAGSGALNNPFNPPIIDRETAICPIPGTAQTTSGEFVRPKDHVHTFFSWHLQWQAFSPIFSIFILSDKKLPTLGQLDSSTAKLPYGKKVL